MAASNDASRSTWRGRWRALAAALLGLACWLPGSAHAADFQDIVAAHSYDDFDGDGVAEIESLAPLFADEAGAETPTNAKLVLVLVEERLLNTISGSAYTSADVLSRLDRLRSDMRAQGFYARGVRARVYSGPKHQDGKTVLALRGFLQATRASYPSLQGVLLVGDFPEALVVRTLLRRFDDERLAVQPRVLARRADLVLADLDGRWHQIYHEAPTPVHELGALDVTAVPGNPGDWPCDGCRVRSADYFESSQTFEDFFWVQDDIYFTQVVGGQLEVTMAELRAGLELSAADHAEPNPIARPEIVVSRLNPRHVAVEPEALFLDSTGRPRSVARSTGPTWTRSAALERRLLIEYLDRNHRHRAGTTQTLRTSAMTFPEADFRLSEMSSFMQQAAGPGFTAPLATTTDPSLLDYANWVRQSAVLKGILAHAERRVTAFGGGYDVAALEQAAGAQIWHWVYQGGSWVPSLSDLGTNASVKLHYSMWRNGVLGTRGAFYIHAGCDTLSPQDAETRRYSDPGYGIEQNGEGMLFFLNGLAYLGRSKDFNDKPFGATAELAEDAERPFGAGWLAQFDVADDDTSLTDVGRKRSYSWNLLGDWTLTLRAPRVDDRVTAFDGEQFLGQLQRLASGTHAADDLAWPATAIDSLVMPASLETRLFHSTNGLGRYATVRGDLARLSTYGYDDWTGSLEVRPRETRAATLFSGAGFTGTSARVPPGHYTYTQLRDTFGIAPLTISALQLDGVDVFAYDRQTWWNNWRVFASSVSDLTPYGWNDRIESVVVVPKNRYVTGYQYEGYAGKHVVVEPGRYDTADLQALGLDGWAISSLYVGSEVRVTAYRQAGFQGPPLVLESSVGDLGPLGYNNNILSMIVERR